MKQIQSIDTLINNAINQSISYDEFVNLMNQLVAINSTTGQEKTDALVNYTRLNQRRFKRWDKTLKISEDVKNEVEKFSRSITWLVLTESWCGDAAHVMPAMNKIVKLNYLINIKVVLRDQNPELMDAFLTNGSKSIPKVIILDNDTNEVLGSYGPRPSKATKLVDNFKKVHGKLTPEFKEELQRWYNKDKGHNTMNDLVKILKSLND